MKNVDDNDEWNLDNIKSESIFFLIEPGFHFSEREILGWISATSILFIESTWGFGVK